MDKNNGDLKLKPNVENHTTIMFIFEQDSSSWSFKYDVTNSEIPEEQEKS